MLGNIIYVQKNNLHHFHSLELEFISPGESFF